MRCRLPSLVGITIGLLMSAGLGIERAWSQELPANPAPLPYDAGEAAKGNVYELPDSEGNFAVDAPVGVDGPELVSGVFFCHDQLAAPDQLEAVEGEGDAVEVDAANVDGKLSRRPGRVRTLLSSETFTTDQSYKANPGRTRFVGDGRLSAQFGSSMVYNSNSFLLSETGTRGEDEDIEGGSFFLSDLTLGFRGGLPSGSGLYYSMVYGADFYSDGSSESSLDHALRGEVGLRGGFTELSGFAGFTQDSGNGFGVRRRSREAPQAKSVNSDVGFAISRDLASGSLEFGAASQLQDYDDEAIGVSDRSRWALDAAWFYNPASLGYTTFGPGITYGHEDVDGSYPQFFFSPSLRARWSPTALVDLGGWVGLETRWRDGSDGSKSTPVYGIDASWTAGAHTKLTAGLERSVNQSITLLNRNIETTTARLSLNQELGGMRSATLDYRYELADYGSGETEGSRNENFHQLGASVNKEFHFDDFPQGMLSLFYNYNINKGDAPGLEYNQHLLGLRMGFSF